MKKAQTMIAKILKGRNVSFVSTKNKKHSPSIDAIVTIKGYDNIGSVSATIKSPSYKIRYFENNPESCLHICDLRSHVYVKLNGTIKFCDTVDNMVVLQDKYTSQNADEYQYVTLEFKATDGRLCNNGKAEDFTIS